MAHHRQEYLLQLQHDLHIDRVLVPAQEELPWSAAAAPFGYARQPAPQQAGAAAAAARAAAPSSLAGKRAQAVREQVRGPWTAQEDQLLMALVRENGAHHWSLVAKDFPGRTAKQCRERWYNHLDPDVRKDKWTQEEDCIIVAMQREVGNSWASISKVLKGRTPNSVKNRWNSCLKRLVLSGEFELPQGFQVPKEGYTPPPSSGPPRPLGARQVSSRRRSRSRERKPSPKRTMDEISHTTAEDLASLSPGSDRGTASPSLERNHSPTTIMSRMSLQDSSSSDPQAEAAPEGEAYGMFSLESAPQEPDVKKQRSADPAVTQQQQQQEQEQQQGWRRRSRSPAAERQRRRQARKDSPSVGGPDVDSETGSESESADSSATHVPRNPLRRRSRSPSSQSTPERGHGDSGGSPLSSGGSGLASSRGTVAPSPIETTEEEEDPAMMVETDDGHHVPIHDYWTSGSASTPSWNQWGTPMGSGAVVPLTPGLDPLVSPSYGMQFGSLGFSPAMSTAEAVQAMEEDYAFLYNRSPSRGGPHNHHPHLPSFHPQQQQQQARQDLQQPHS